jgi:hypothetical protein
MRTSVAKTTLWRHKKMLEKAAQRLYPGTWHVTTATETTIILQKQQRPDDGAATKTTDLFRHCLQLAHIRSKLLCGTNKTRDFVPRQVPWKCVSAVWSVLTESPRVLPLTANNQPGAYVNPQDRLRQLLTCISRDAGLACPGSKATKHDLWLRLGIDGVALWHSSVVSVTMFRES